MRTDDLSGGSLKALLLVLLIAANLLATLPNDRGGARTQASAGVSRAPLGTPPSARTTSGTQEQGVFSARAPKNPRPPEAARTFPGQPQP